MAEAEKESVRFPADEEDWPEVKAILQSLSILDNAVDGIFSSLTDLFNIIERRNDRNSNAKDITETCFGGLKTFYNKYASEGGQIRFTETVAYIAKLALQASDLRPQEGLHYSKQQEPVQLHLSRKFVAGIVASGFLCLFKSANNENIPSVGFEMFFSGINARSQRAKLEMILNYFHRLSILQDGPKGSMTFTRIVLDKESLLGANALETCDSHLVPFIVDEANKIEDAGSNVLQVDFANEYLGGGVLFQGNVQEEIRFSVCPELISSMLFMECMAPNEAIILEGFEQFSLYTGYGGGLDFDGDFQDAASRDKCGNILTSLVAIDAVPYSMGGEEQYSPSYFMRDINKAYAGFQQPGVPPCPEDMCGGSGDAAGKSPDKEDSWVFNLNTNYKRTIATGNWGCGVFGGDPQLKSMLQWICVSYAKCPALIYYTFKDRNVDNLRKAVDKIMSKKWTIKKLFSEICAYCEHRITHDEGIPFFSTILNE